MFGSHYQLLLQERSSRGAVSDIWVPFQEAGPMAPVAGPATALRQ
jgi:hypothetical protein